MGVLGDLFWALWNNTMSLWSGVIGIVFAGIGLLCWFQGVEQWDWFVLAGVVSLIIAPYVAWIEEHKVRLELEKIRPHVVLEGVSAATIRAYASRVPGNQSVPEASYLPAWIMGRGNGYEALMYDIMNGEILSARELMHYCRITLIDRLKIETEVRLPEQPHIGEVLVPKQSMTRQVIVPSGTFYSEKEEIADVRIIVLVTYLGQSSDSNLYYYRTVLRAKQFPRSSAGTIMPGVGNVVVESMKEGIVENIDNLLCR